MGVVPNHYIEGAFGLKERWKSTGIAFLWKVFLTVWNTGSDKNFPEERLKKVVLLEEFENELAAFSLRVKLTALLITAVPQARSSYLTTTFSSIPPFVTNRLSFLHFHPFLFSISLFQTCPSIFLFLRFKHPLQGFFTSTQNVSLPRAKGSQINI